MKKLYLIPALLCFLVGILQAAPNKTWDGTFTTFPSCSIGVSAFISGSGSGGGTSPICPGSPVSLASSVTGGIAPFTYSWTPGAGLSNASIANPVATVSVTTTYTLSVTDNAGCSGTASVTIAVAAPPVIQPDSVLEEYLTGHALTATGGVPPYTYTFSPSINTNSLLSLPNTNTTFTITVTGANGCSSTEYAHYVPVTSTEACSSLYMSEYIQDTVMGSLGGMNDAIELYNPTSHSINLNTYYLTGTTNGSLLSPPFIIPLSGTISPYSTFLIANSHATSSLTSRANMLSSNLNFNGKDIVSLENVCINQPNVTCTFLDEVGAISPLPTDSGWAVGAGSTKNHTLVRHAYVTRGTLDWNTCKSEWRVCPQGTFSHIGLYNNKCTPGSPDLLLTIANPTLTCGGSQYLEFDVMASSSVPSYFDNCLMDIQYSGTAFGDNVVSNGNVTITKGTNFNNATYFDPNSNAGDISPDTLNIAFGVDLSQPSWTRTQIDAIPQQLLHVKMKIQDCGVNAGIYYTDMGFTKGFSSYTQNASDSLQYNMEYDTTYYTGSCNQVTCTPQITNFNSPINAGTNDKSIPANSSILTITGSGFGGTRGTIQVTNANAAGMVVLDTVDILLWQDNQITVKMPDYLFNDSIATPGSGPFIVKNTCGDSATDNLIINYNIENSFIATEKVRPNIVMSNDTTSIIWRCDTSIWNNPEALACVKKAIKTWNCYTGVNWKLSNTPIIKEITQHDSISVIYFSNSGSNFETPSTLMQTLQWPLPDCLTPYHDSVGFYNEADIQIRRNQYVISGKKWSYDMTYGVADTSHDSNYFYDAILHELGHAHGLNHINTPLSLMYRSNIPGHRDSIPEGSQTLDGAFDMIHTSKVYPPNCVNDSILLTSSTACIDPDLSVPIISAHAYNLNLFPNPTNGIGVTIAYELPANSTVQFKITDCLGRTLFILPQKQEAAGDHSEQFNVTNFSQGVYIFIANINGECQTIKFIKL